MRRRQLPLLLNLVLPLLLILLMVDGGVLGSEEEEGDKFHGGKAGAQEEEEEEEIFVELLFPSNHSVLCSSKAIFIGEESFPGSCLMTSSPF